MQRDMECIYMVYKTGSFSKAAELLFASQPAVSMAVHRVEEELGCRLFDRNAHPLRLTAAGKLYLEHIERSIRSEETLLQQLARLSGQGSTQLRIGCTPMHATCLIPGVLAKFNELSPGIDIRVLSCFPKNMQQKLREREIDIAVSTMSEEGSADLRYLPAFHVQYLMAVPPDMPINGRLRDFALSGAQIRKGEHLHPRCPRVPIEVFADVPFIALSEGTDSYEQECRIFSASGFLPDTVLTVSNPDGAYALAKSGMGATLVGSFSVAEDAPLVYYRLRSKHEDRPFYFVLRSGEELSPVQRLFIEVFRNHMS